MLQLCQLSCQCILSVAVLACRLEEGCTWDYLLSSVAKLIFRFTLLRGGWSLDLAAAALRLKGRRSLEVEQDEEGDTWITSPASALILFGIAAVLQHAARVPDACGLTR